MNSTFRTIDGRDIAYCDPKGVTHHVEGANVHPGVRLLWTLCKKDVPANAAHYAEPGDSVDCPECCRLDGDA